jgi:hypothetical protein
MDASVLAGFEVEKHGLVHAMSRYPCFHLSFCRIFPELFSCDCLRRRKYIEEKERDKAYP